MLIKDTAEERHRVRVLEVTSQYETQLKTQRDRHDSDMEKLRAGQVQMMADIRENYQQELSKKQIMMDKTLAELRVADTNEVHRTKEDWQARIEEKNEEIRALRHIASNERARMEALIVELENARGDNRERQSNLELLRAELQVKIDENHVLHGVRKELQDLHQKYTELNEKFRQENLEKAQTQVRLEAVHKENDEMRRRYAETEAELVLTKQELAKLSYVNTELGSKTETADSLMRDNERWKVVHHKLQSDLVEANHKHFAVNKDYDYLKDEHQKLRATLETLQSEHRHVSLALEDLRVQDKERTQSLHVEKEQRQRLEASLQEHRVRWIPMVNKMETCRTQLDRYHKLLVVLGQERNVLWEKIAPMLRMLQQAMRAWDASLGTMMEGDASMGKAGHGAAATGMNGAAPDSAAAFPSLSLFSSSSMIGHGSFGNNGSNEGSYDQTPSSPGLQFSLFSNPPTTATAVSTTSPGFSSFFPTHPHRHGKSHRLHSKSSRRPTKRASHHRRPDEKRKAEDFFLGAKMHWMGEEEEERVAPDFYSSGDASSSSGSEDEHNVAAAESALQLLHQRQSQQLETFRQDMAVCIERVQWKMQKLGKFRLSLTQQVTVHVKSVEQVHLLAQEKCHSLQQKLTETQQQLVRMQQIVQRDQQQHAQEVGEVQQLRDVLLQQHAAQVRQFEVKLDHAQVEKETANHMIEQQQRQISRYQDELRLAQESLAAVKDELLHLESLEDTVSLVTSRLESLLSEKALVAKELQYQREETRRVQGQLSSLHEHATLVQEDKEREEQRRGQWEEKCGELADRIDRLESENESLRRRQIDPQLALVLMDSQQQLPQPAPAVHGSNGAAVIDRDTLLALEDRLQQLQLQAQVSVQRLERMASMYPAAFTTNGNIINSTTNTTTTTTNYALVHDTHNNLIEECMAVRLQVDTLLQEQVSLVQRVVHLISLVKFSHQRFLPSSSASAGSVSPHHPSGAATSYPMTSRHPHGSNGRFSMSGSMRMDDLASAPYTPMTHGSLVHSSASASASASASSSAHFRPPSSTVLPSSPGEKEELIVFGQHNRGLFSRSVVPPSHPHTQHNQHHQSPAQQQPPPPQSSSSSLSRKGTNDNVLTVNSTNRKKAASGANLLTDYVGGMHEDTALGREAPPPPSASSSSRPQLLFHRSHVDSAMNEDDAAMVAEVRRRVQQVSSQRLFSTSSSSSSSPVLSTKRGSGRFGFSSVPAATTTTTANATAAMPPTASFFGSSSSTVTIDDSLSQALLSPTTAATTTTTLPTTVSYERQQTKKRLQQVDRRVQMLAKKLDKFDIASAAN
jgi:hypothetical protein